MSALHIQSDIGLGDPVTERRVMHLIDQSLASYGERMDELDRKRITAIEERLEAGDDRMSAIEKMVADVHEIIVTAQGFFRFLGYIGIGIKWIATTIAAVAAIYAAWKGIDLKR